jgi:hypothetical protein
MERRGQPTAMATNLLDTFEALQATYVAGRDFFRTWLEEDLTRPGRRPAPRGCAGSGSGSDESLDPHAVAALLDELVEQTYSILSDCGGPGVPTAHQTINQLLCLFESGGGFAARCQAEQLLRPS